MRKLILILFLTVSLIFAEKYAIIYSPVKEDLSVAKSSSNLDPKDMEIVWKETFLKWEELVQDNYKFENIYVLYGEGIDYYRYLGVNIVYRYTPAHFCLMRNYKITKGNATEIELDKKISEIGSKIKDSDSLKIWKYIDEKFIVTN